MLQRNKSNDAWKKLFDKYHILDIIQHEGFYIIEAEKIKEFREPRLMAKWDCSSTLPTILKDTGINILPIDRKSYVLAHFKLFQTISNSDVLNCKNVLVKFPSAFQTLRPENITSESGAVNVMLLSGILDDFTSTKRNVRTFDGRMSTGNFKFQIDTFDNVPLIVNVNNAQCEIDGGFENENSVVIIEMKNSILDDFNIRQLIIHIVFGQLG